MNSVNQENITTGGDVVGRDKIERNIFYGHNKKTTMSRLVEKFKRESAASPQIKNVIEKLNHYKQSADGDLFIGLERKLIDGKREDLILSAKRKKEQAAKKILKLEYSEAAQEIISFVLSDIKTRFEKLILPKIRSGVSNDEIDKSIYHEIIDASIQNLEENPLSIDSEEIDGMIYFLTGNCHLIWS
ncbi:MAG TPA: hypothetical protein PKB11_01660 [Desulfovibrio sp.]|uniref:ABC-three component system protein n=1 Tax=Desulfovibrio sp. TaxID=885 RepID=UPI002B9347DC|nr:ABC-three component system protein [Desulfovibrio sp.]HMM37438.1 hypothetical protein [Desulfovibrio sp.]